MKYLPQYILLAASFISLAACGGNDTADRLDVADPVVRFVHAAPLSSNLTLSRNDVAKSDATNIPYLFASDYSYAESGSAQWSVKTTQGNLPLGSISIDAVRGNRYTIVALPSTSTANSLYEIRDPYNKSITSDKAKLRIMNASFNASSIDVYITALGTDISAPGIVPAISATAYKTSGPISGRDSLEVSDGNFQIAITRTGAKELLFKGVINIAKNKDILILTVPDSLLPNTVKALIKIEGTAGSTEIPAS
jgi:Domain of unknown function (DUF4397)